MRLAAVIILATLIGASVGAMLWARRDYRNEQDELAACRPAGGVHRPEWVAQLAETTRRVDPLRRQEALVAVLAARWKRSLNESDLVELEAAQAQLDGMRRRDTGRAMVRPAMLDDGGSN